MNRILLIAISLIPLGGHSQIFPMKEVYGKKPMKLDPSLKSVAQKLETRRQGGISSVLKYDIAEYAMVDVRHKLVKSNEFSFPVFGFLSKAAAGGSKSKTGFSFTVTDHKADTARIVSVLFMQDAYVGAYDATGSISFPIQDKSTDIYTSNLVLSGDSSKWEIVVKDRMRFLVRSEPEVIGVISNGSRKMNIRLVAEMESGEPAKLTAPGFEVIEDGKVLMAVQYVGPPMKEPIIWIQPDLSHADRFLLISAAASLVARIDEANAGNRMDGM